MEAGFRSPLVDLFRRGEADRDARLLAARGALAPRAHEQLALFVVLFDDPDEEIRGTVARTVASLPREPLSAFLARADVPDEIRSFFADFGVKPTTAAADAVADNPLIEAADPDPDLAEAEGSEPKVLASLPVTARLKLAMRGTREQRSQLIRDSNRLVATAVLASPKLSEAEVEAFVKMGNVSDEVLRIIGTNRTWLKNYGVVLGLTRNPKTPPGLSMQLLHRLTERDLKMLSMDRNVPELLRTTARRLIVKSLK
jgi:hypothetical protein